VAELLVKAQNHWMDDLKPAEVTALSDKMKEGYEQRSQKGDVIVVKPDGHNWGKCECLPEFIVVKVPGISLKDAVKYQDALYDGDVLVKKRKHSIDVTSEIGSSLSVVSMDKTVAESKLTVKQVIK